MNEPRDKELLLPSPASTPFFSSTEERLGSESLLSVVENYIQYYASGETHTARAKRYDLQYFLEFLAGSPGSVNRVMVSEWTLQRTKDFIDDRLSRGEAPATVARRLATIKHFGRTLAERFAGYINPAREVKGPVLNLTRPSGLSEEDITLLRQAITALESERKNTFLNIRGRFLLELLLVTGLRADEVRLLVIPQLSDDLQWLKNVKTKGKRYRNVYVSSELRPLFQRYLDIRMSSLMERFPLLQSAPPSHLLRFPVLVSFYNADPADATTFGLSPKTVFNIVSRLGKRAESLSGGRLHPHKLRHTFAHGLLDSSRDIRLVAQALGHSDVRTTMRYTERSEQEIALAIEKQRG